MAEAPSALPKPPGQPFTFGGVARYSGAGAARFVLSALCFGLAAGAVLATLFTWRWAPVLREAVGNLPSASSIHSGRLEWPPGKAGLLGANAFVSFAAGPGAAEVGAHVDVAFEFGVAELKVRSLLGVASLPYPPRWKIPLNRTVLQPWWGAWERALPPMLAAGAALGLVLTWGLLALPYAAAVRVLSAVARKSLTFGQAWKVSVAAQWPGALLLSFAIALYAAGETTLLFVLGAFAAHFLLTWVYLLIAPFFLPAPPSDSFHRPRKKRGKKNPFSDE